jgi:alpha-D-xyloside xylohydrolase
LYIDLLEYDEFFKSPFLGDNLTLYIPRKIKNLTCDGPRIAIGLEAAVCSKQPMPVSFLMRGRSFSFTGSWAPMCMLLEFVNPGLLRIRFNRGGEIIKKQQPMLAGEPSCSCSPELSRTGSGFVLQTGVLRVVFQNEPFCMDIFDAEGRLLYGQYNDDGHNVTANHRQGISEAGGDEEGLKAKNSFPAFEVFPFACVINEDTGGICYCDSVKMAYNEKFYGFGEQFSSLNKRGRKINIWTVNPLGVSTAKAYKPVAFFMSSRGYGVYVNSPRRIRFNMGDYFYKAYSFEVEDEALDFFIIAGDFKKVLDEYTGLTGKPRLPPKWAFGVWMSRNCYRSRDEVLGIAHRLREEQLPCDVLHIDWDYCKSFTFDFEFDETRFQNPGEMTARLEEMGFKVSIWQLPYIKFDSPVFTEAAERGYLARHTNGETADTEAREGVIDFSNPEAVLWYQEKLKSLLKLGIRVIKTDFGENAREDYRYKNIDGRDMHNMYPLLYNKAAWEAVNETHHGDGLVWGRSACAGCQRYPVFWGGDSDSDYSGLYHSLRGGLSIGLSGFPLWSHDVGGYFSAPDPELYIRWMQFGMLSSLVRFHGTSSREPWTYGEDAVAMYRKYAALRYSLLEYIYNEARLSVLHSVPLMRALILDFSHDLSVYAIDDQYMFGENLMVAPVLSPEKKRDIYLPSGASWMDYHTGEIIQGGRWISRETPLDIIPVYFKSDTITLFTQAVQYSGGEREKQVRVVACCTGRDCRYVSQSSWLDGTVGFSYRNGGKTLEIALEGFKDFRFDFELHAPGLRDIRVNGEVVQTETTGRDTMLFHRPLEED